MAEFREHWRRTLAGGVILLATGIWVDRNAGDFALRPVRLDFDVQALFSSAGFILLSFLCLVLSWWVVARSGRQAVSFVAALRAWTLTNVLRYRPSHGESVERMTALAVGAGVPASYATGAAFLPRLITLAAASAVAAGLFLLNTTSASAPLVGLASLIVAGSLAAAIYLTTSDAAWRVSILIRRPNSIRPLEQDAIGMALLLDLAGFLAQGAGLSYFALGLLDANDLPLWTATGGLAAAYVVGRLLPVLPSGLLVREAILMLLLQNWIGIAPAFTLAVLWRVALTLFEIAVAAPFLTNRSTS